MQPTKGLFGGPVPRFARTCLNDSGAFALFEKSSRRRMGSWELWILAAICVSGLRIDAVGRKRLEGQRACVCLGLK